MNVFNNLKNTVFLMVALAAASVMPSYTYAKDSDKAAVKQSTAFNIPVKDIQRFTTVIAQIKRYYIKDTTDKELFNNAIRGMLTNLDPHSAYLDSEDLADLETVTTGEFGGIEQIQR